MNEEIQTHVIDEIDDTQKRLELLVLLLMENAQLKQRVVKLESRLNDVENAVDVLVDEAEIRNYS